MTKLKPEIKEPQVLPIRKNENGGISVAQRRVWACPFVEITNNIIKPVSIRVAAHAVTFTWPVWRNLK
ncbi:hypothetical protein GCM10009409_30970 [Shewanella saliphila]|uniref:Uncharacterized protein n=1 Tax=Shewanella saliphila TaxID=2282698 RepID=A0ABQ2QB65_9GAMM|nr:hypothetical protein GCM10009409_30970 [Shewanella saliphila]